MGLADMKASDLVRELDVAIAALGEPGRRRLTELGIPPELIEPPLAMIGLANIRVSANQYEPDPHGGAALVTPVLIGNPGSPEAVDPERTVRRAGALIDLVAWRPDRPDMIATRTGAASWLGAIEPQYLAPSPVAIWRSPLGWLRAGCRGLALLTPDPAEGWRILSDCTGGVVAEGEQHAAELRRILERPWPMPTVWARRPVRAIRHAA
jgi:hypothetical protein